MNYYQLLQIPADSSEDLIRKGFRSQAKLCHPDRFPGQTPEEHARRQKHFIAITRAYEVLRDPLQRRQYDRTLKKASPENTSRSAHTASQKTTKTNSSKNESDFKTKTTDYASEEDSFDEFLKEVDALLEQWGGSRKDPLSALMDWAQKLFFDVEKNTEETKTDPQPQTPRPKPPASVDDSAVIEAELNRLKQKHRPHK